MSAAACAIRQAGHTKPVHGFVEDNGVQVERRVRCIGWSADHGWRAGQQVQIRELIEVDVDKAMEEIACTLEQEREKRSALRRP
ncbi:MAG: hypothetical protein WAT74_00780 [Flavobacteriales bacterium]